MPHRSIGLDSAPTSEYAAARWLQILIMKGAHERVGVASLLLSGFNLRDAVHTRQHVHAKKNI
jgi:hypothetical protein